MNGTTTDRSLIFDYLGGERDYQDDRWNKEKHTITEFLVYIRDYTEEALHTETRAESPDCDISATHSMRKIAALAIACMEQNGALPRKNYEKPRLVNKQ